jgi:hypothetical protein
VRLPPSPVRRLPSAIARAVSYAARWNSSDPARIGSLLRRLGLDPTSEAARRATGMLPAGPPPRGRREVERP